MMGRTGQIQQAGRATLLAPAASAMVRLAEWGRRWQMRRALAPVSEALLRDIGLTPDDVAEALAQPLDEESSDTLLKAAMARAGNW